MSYKSILSAPHGIVGLADANAGITKSDEVYTGADEKAAKAICERARAEMAWAVWQNTDDEIVPHVMRANAIDDAIHWWMRSHAMPDGPTMRRAGYLLGISPDLTDEMVDYPDSQLLLWATEHDSPKGRLAMAMLAARKRENRSVS